MSSLQEKAIQLLDANSRSGDTFYYTAPSPRKYPHQWSWDSAFHAIVNCHLGRPELAKREIRTLLSKMSPDGALPHIIFHQKGFGAWNNRLFRFYWPQRDRSPLVQPPVVALAVSEIWKKTGDRDFLHETLHLVERHFEWLKMERRFGNSVLVSIVSPWECGMDHKPAFDPILGKLLGLPFGRYLALYSDEVKLAWHRFNKDAIAQKGYFNVREVLFNTIYAQGLEAIGQILEETGKSSKAAAYFESSRKVNEAIWRACYDRKSGYCFDIDVNSGKYLPQPSISCLMPLALSDPPTQKYTSLLNHLTSEAEFWLKYPVPSVPQDDPHFVPHSQRYLWRGPTWINTNWLLAIGLRQNGYHELADAIAKSSRELVELSGFREYYHPLTGEGGGEEDFSWSTLAAII